MWSGEHLLDDPADDAVIQFALPEASIADRYLAGCAADERQYRGGAIGTTWSLTYLGAPNEVSPSQVQSEVNAAFSLVNESMNHYDPSSLISEFNALPAQTPIEVDWDFTYVLSAALELTAATRGAYDVSVSALSDLWGFGPEGPRQFPDATDIEMTRAQVGVAQLDWESTTRTLSKTRARVAKLDFSSLAKGYAVDLGADALEDLDIPQFMLEVGGEVRVRVRARGETRGGSRWSDRKPVRGGIQGSW